MLLRTAWAAVATVLLSSCSGGFEGGLNLTHVSWAYPHFYKLEVFDDGFTAISPDATTLRGFTFDGRERWRRPIAGDPLIDRYDEAHLSVQEENTVFRLRAADGAVEQLFDVPPHQRFVMDRTNGLVYLRDRRFEKRAFQLLDPDSRAAIWQREDIESVLHVDRGVVVVETAAHDYAENLRSYSIRDVAVAGVDRRTGKTRWRVAMGDFSGYVRAAAVPPCLVAIDNGRGGGLLCIDPASGRILGRRLDPSPWGLSYSDVVAAGSQVAFLERTRDGETFLRFASVPAFEISESLRLASDEPSLALQGDRVFVTGLYAAFCFDRHTGDLRWKRALVGDWKLLGDRILLSDYRQWRRRARLVMLDVASGRERVLLSEPATLPERR